MSFLYYYVNFNIFEIHIVLKHFKEIQLVKLVSFWVTCFRILLPSYKNNIGERSGSVVECWTPEREVGGSKPTAAVLYPWARHFTPRKYWLITQEAVAPSRHDWKIVDWDVKPQHKQKKRNNIFHRPSLFYTVR